MRLRLSFKIYLIISALVFSFGIINEVKCQKKAEIISVILKVMDVQGIPVENACIKIEGILYGYTGKDGLINIESFARDIVVITKIGYTASKASVEELKKDPTVKLNKQSLFMSSTDDIQMPFMTIKKRHITSSAYVIRGEEMEKYPTIDVRNSFTGLAPGLLVREMNGALGMSSEEPMGWRDITEKVRLSSRGSTLVYIIDDVPTDVSEVQMEQMDIESVTIIKDIVGKAMYGPQAAEGIIFIRTKRGNLDRNILRVNAESGFGIIDRFPRWASGADYATLNNLARTSNGLSILYSQADYIEYAKNDPYNMYHPSVDWFNMMLNNSKSIRKANISYERGQENVKFFSNIGYSGEDDIYKLGSTSDYNRINVRSNLDIAVNQIVSLNLNLFGGVTIRRSPNYGYGLLNIIEFNRIISDITTIPPVVFPIYANYDANKEVYWYSEDPNYNYNPIGRLEANGFYNEYGRTGISSIGLNYDMQNILKGLKSKTYFNFNIFNQIRLGKDEQYIGYRVIPSKTTEGQDTVLLTLSHIGAEQAGMAKLNDYYYQRFSGYQSFTYNKRFGSNSFFQSSLTYILSKTARQTIVEPERQQNVVFSNFFTQSDKYSIQGVLNYAGSASLPPGRRYSLFPALGAGWILSEENFLSGISWINFLKLRGEVGILGYEAFNPPWYWEDNYTYTTTAADRQTGASPTGYWFGTELISTRRTIPSRIGNPDITWEKRKEFSIGLDALMFDHKIELEVNYFNNLRDGILTNLTHKIPLTTGITYPNYYSNFNKIRYKGVESSIRYSNQVYGLKYSIGSWVTFQNSKILKWDEPNYRFNYQSRVGKPAGAYFGLTYIGKFITDSETNLIPQLFDESLTVGDLKYKDMNKDGVIDDNDMSLVGNTSPNLIYALNLKLNYRNFELTVIGDGIAIVDLPLTNKVFWNGWGDNNYSEFVKDNIGGLYPRLTYYKVNNNFKNSDFWLTKGDYFKLQNVELAYILPIVSVRQLHLKGCKVFVRGANLLTITKVKYIDPESPNSGVTMYPLFRTFTFGLNLIL